MKFIWVEIIKFFKNNLLKIVAGTALIAILFVWSNNRTASVEIDEDLEANEGTVFGVDSEPATFRFFVESDDGKAFTNNLLIEQYITRTEILGTVSRQTNTQLKDLVEETGNKALVDYNESGESKIIGIARDGNSHLLEFYVNIGNESDNLEIADYYYEYIAEGNIPFISNKTMFVFHEPKIKEFADEIAFDSIGSKVRTSSILKDTIIGLLIGGVAVTGLLLVVTFLSRKIKYSFSYSLMEDDYFFLVDKKLNFQDELEQILSTPKDSNRIIMTESTSEDFNHQLENILPELTNNLNGIIRNNFLEIDNPDEVDRIIYIILENETSREWYNKQRRLERAYTIPSTIVQINKN